MQQASANADTDAGNSTVDKTTLDATWAHLARSQVRRRRALGALAILAICVLPWVASAWTHLPWIHESLEWAGLALLILAVLGRSACMLYLGGRKGADLVTDGPYSISRNSLYVFSILAVLGIGLQTGSLLVGLILAALASLIFRWIVGEEEILLQQAFGGAYQAYCQKTPRFLPKWSLWQSPAYVTVDLQGIWKTVRDALPYFLSIPVFEAIEYAQDMGWVHPFVFLY